MDLDHDIGKITGNLTILDPGHNVLTISSTTGVQLPVGNTSQRPTFSNGLMRYNSESGFVEIATGGEWVNIKQFADGMLPPGGAVGDYLVKSSTTDYDFAFIDRAKASVITVYAKNNTANTIPKGTPVCQVGVAGNGKSLLIEPADAANPLKMPAIGVLGEDVLTQAEGSLLILGEIDGVNTSTFSEGDLVYVAPGGGYTNIKPTGADVATQFLGIVTKVHATNGAGVITGTGTLDVIKQNNTNEFYLWNGTSWIHIATDSEVVHKAGDSMTGSLSLPKTKGEGLLIDNGYSWMDIIGDISPKQLGTSGAVLRPYRDQVNGWTHNAGTYGELTYHMPHNYAPGTDLFIHMHWGHNGTNITGSFIVKFYVSYAKRTYPATEFSSQIVATLTVNDLNLTNSPQYCHRVDEIQLSTPGGSSSMLNTNDIETDGLVMIHYVIDTIPSITGSAIANLPYMQTIDLHVQSTNVGTKNKDPDFWN